MRTPPVREATKISRADVFEVEVLMKALPQGAYKMEHHFSLGIYGREVLIPKGSLLTGELHKYPQLNVLLKGDISVLIDGEIVRMKAPGIVNSPAGTKRIAYAHEDTIWLTILGTHETSVEAIEKNFIAKTEKEYYDFVAASAPESLKCLS